MAFTQETAVLSYHIALLSPQQLDKIHSKVCLDNCRAFLAYRFGKKYVKQLYTLYIKIHCDIHTTVSVFRTIHVISAAKRFRLTPYICMYICT